MLLLFMAGLQAWDNKSVGAHPLGMCLSSLPALLPRSLPLPPGGQAQGHAHPHTGPDPVPLPPAPGTP
jgi:hypothetical protein